MFSRAEIKLIAITIMFLSVCLLSLKASAYDNKNNNVWYESIKSLKSDKSPIAKKLYIWLNVTNDKNILDTQDLISFVFNNEQWPSLHKFREKIEDDIEIKVKPNGIRLWFDRTPPQTYSGLRAYIDALVKLDRGMEARDNIKKLWVTAILKKHETIEIYKDYNQFLRSEDLNERLEYLLWNKRFYEAGYLFPLIDEKTKRIAQTRMALSRTSYRAEDLLKTLSDEERLDEGIIYERAKWRRRKDKTDAAIEMLTLQPENSKYAKLWWQERNILSRRKIEETKYQEAYNIIVKHGLDKSTEEYSQAEWLAGWLALRFLNNPSQAYNHFENLYNTVNSAISRSRAAYWLGRADEALGNKNSAKNWYKLATQFSSTFYGQLAAEKISEKISKDLFANDIIFSKDNREFNDNELVTAIRLLHKYNLNKYTKNFFIKLLQNAKSRNDYMLIASLAKEVDEKKYIVEANKRAQQYLGLFMFEVGYPELDSDIPNKSDKSLIHAITYRESMFDQKAISSAGARGLMQLMPSTAKVVAKKTKSKYNKSNLTQDPDYNLKLGIAYIEDLVQKYNGFYPLAIAAYNAGPNNVTKWIRQFGDPREKTIDLVDWIELIPIYETRNYVQRVMETYYIYQLKFDEKPKTVSSFIE